MNKIDEFHLLVHPDYDVSGNTNTQQVLPYQQALRDDWEAHIQELSTRTDTALIYVSTLDKQTLTSGIEDRDTLTHPFYTYDVERIERWQRLLGLRLVVFPNLIDITPKRLTNALTDHRLSYDENSVKLYAFGEYTRNCVERYGSDVRRALGISFWGSFLRTGILHELSLDREQSMHENWRHVSFKERL